MTTPTTPLEPTLENAFGANALQDISTLQLSKADFASVGLTALDSNSADQLAAAIVLKLGKKYTVANRELNKAQSFTVEASDSNGSVSIDYQNSKRYATFAYTLTFYVETEAVDLDPDLLGTNAAPK